MLSFLSKAILFIVFSLSKPILFIVFSLPFLLDIIIGFATQTLSAEIK